MSKRLLADDKLESEEEEELTQQQAIIKAIMQNRLINVVADIGQMAHAFRFHPIRFLDLLKTSKALINAVARAEQSGGAFAIWYKMCLYSFPDYIIALKACDYDFLPKTGFDLDNNGLARISPVWCDFYMPAIRRPGVYYLFGFNHRDALYWTNTAMEQDNVRFRDTDDMAWGMWRTRMDRSFSSQETRQECLQSREKALDVSWYFRMVFPVSIPPAEYCMASTVSRHKLAMEFLHLLCDTADGTTSDALLCREVFSNWVQILTEETTLTPRHRSLKKYYKKDLPWAPVVTFDDWTESDENVLEFSGEGPSGVPFLGRGNIRYLDMEREDYSGDLFTMRQFAPLVLYASRRLKELVASVTDPADNKRLTAKITQCRSLYERVVLDLLRYSVMKNEDRVPAYCVAFDSKYHSDYTESMFPTPFTTTHNWQAERAADMELYGTHDPLYWDVLLADLKRMEDIAWVESLSPAARDSLVRGNQHAFELYRPPGAWKQVLLDLLNMFVYPADNTNEEFQRLSSPMPAIALKCAHCNEVEPKIAQIQAPFRAYCDKECQLKAVLATQ